MKATLPTLALVVWALAAAPKEAGAQTPLGTAFTYQGHLIKDGLPVIGPCDFEFTLWDAEIDGNTVEYDPATDIVVIISATLPPPRRNLACAASPATAETLCSGGYSQGVGQHDAILKYYPSTGGSLRN